MRKTLYMIVIANLFSAACDTEESEETSVHNVQCGVPSECADLKDKPCAGCPQLAETLCDHGECIERGADEIDVVIDVMLDTGEVTQNTSSLVYVVASQNGGSSEHTCISAFLSTGELAEDLNIFAAGYKSVSGGSYHENLSLGRCPNVPIIIMLWGTDGVGGEGSVTGQGCTEIAAGDLVEETPLISVK